jgi:hypothetical protein
MDTFIQENPTTESLKQRYIMRDFFPFKRVNEYNVVWDIMLSGNRLAGLYAHDGTPIPGQGYDFKQMMSDVTHLMASRTIKPAVLLELRQIGELSVHNTFVESHRQRLLEEIGKMITDCQNRVEGVIEYLCTQALTGTIDWPPVDDSGVAISNPPASWGNVAIASLDLGFRSTFKQAATTLSGWNSESGGGYAWSDTTNSTPRADLDVINTLFEETTGISMDGATILMSRTMLRYLGKNAELLKYYEQTSGGGYGGRFLDPSQVERIFETELGYKIRTYDAKWTYPSDIGATATAPTENQVRFLNRKWVIIIPQGVLGEGNASFAVAPDLGAPNGENLGLYSWSHGLEKPPWTREVGCGIHGFPMFKSSQELFVFDALN